MSKRNWYTRAIHLMVALAFVLGLAIVPGMVTAQGEPSLVPSIDFDVKGAIHKVCIDWNGLDSALYETDWWLVPGAVFNLDDVVVIEPSGPNPYCGGLPYAQTVKDKGFIDNVDCIELQSMKVGDIHIYVDIIDASTGLSILKQPIHAEKKWGELDHTELDLDANMPGVQGPTEEVDFPAGSTGTYNETLEDKVYAWHPEWGVQLVDDAIVHWWLVEDTDDNQDWVDVFMDYLAAHNGSLDDNHWSAHGKYTASELGDRQPWEYINDWVTDPSDPKYVDPALFYWSAVNVPGEINTAPNTDKWYAWAQTYDGIATATLSVNVTALEACTTYKVMIVVLVSYPGGDNPQDDPHNGEQPVCLEKGKKEFHKGKPTEVTEVKTPQLRWAGEKIVLEKDWSDVMDTTSAYIAVYHLEGQSVGELSEADIRLDNERTEGDIWVLMGRVDDSWFGDTSYALLESEDQGEADINCKLYYASITGDPYDLNWRLVGEPIENIGFLVYYLAFEDVTLAEDITPQSSLEDLDAEKPASVAFQVRGWVTSSSLPGTDRPAVDLDGDGIYEMPAGRYVLPDDWAAMAGNIYKLRPNWDLMDQAHHDNITSDSELGPYSGTTTTDGEAEEPCIGPFSTLQQWSTEDMWIADATIPSSLPVDFVRNTVVPDGNLDWYDAPMPQALVIFDIVSGPVDASLSGLDKGDLKGYGFELSVGEKIYQSPFYSVEIPSHQSIPALGYNWASWWANGPYNYWTDLQLKSIISNTNEDPIDPKDVEVYSDNHGIAAVTVDALGKMGLVTIKATAEFPNSLKKGKYGPRVSEEINIYWGYAVVHLDADFEVSVRTGEAPLTVTFYGLKDEGTGEPWTTHGTPPYVKAVWDFDGDGNPDKTVTGTTTAETLATQSFTFENAGIYSPTLTVTDSTPMEDKCVKPGYIVVTGETSPTIWNCPLGGEPLISPNPGAGRPALSVSAACADITVSAGAELWGIYYLIETGADAGTWLWYIPGYTSSTLTQLEPGKLYFLVVSGSCTLTIPQ